MALRKKKAKWLVKLLKVIVAVYLLLILYQLIGNVYSKLSNTHEIQVRGMVDWYDNSAFENLQTEKLCRKTAKSSSK